jgi:hypothetical protein
MAGLDWRSGVGQDSPVAVTVASIGSASPKTHLYLAPKGRSGSVLIVNWTWRIKKNIYKFTVVITNEGQRVQKAQNEKTVCPSRAVITNGPRNNRRWGTRHGGRCRLLMEQQYKGKKPNYIHGTITMCSCCSCSCSLITSKTLKRGAICPISTFSALVPPNSLPLAFPSQMYYTTEWNINKWLSQWNYSELCVWRGWRRDSLVISYQPRWLDMKGRHFFPRRVIYYGHKSPKISNRQL